MGWPTGIDSSRGLKSEENMPSEEEGACGVLVSCKQNEIPQNKDVKKKLHTYS